MAPLHEQPSETTVRRRPPRAPRPTRRPTVQPLQEKVYLPVPTIQTVRGPKFPPYVCGNCQHLVPPPGAGGRVRCPACHRSLHVSTHVRLVCNRCAHTQHVRHTELGVDRVCPSCSNSLSVDQIILPPRRRSRVHRHRHHHGTAPGGRADAAGAVLILGLTILIVVLTLTIF